MKHVYLIGCVLTILLSAEITSAVHNPDEAPRHNKIPVEIRTERADLSPGDTFSAFVALDPAVILKWVDVKIVYDTEQLHCLSSPQLHSSSGMKSTIDPEKGTLAYAGSNTYGSSSEPSWRVCSFTFLAIRPGQADLIWRCFGATLEQDLGPGVPFLLKAASVIISEKKESFTDLHLPDCFDLSQNYPNPFNPETRLTYQLPDRSHVRLTVYNILGQEVRTLVNANQGAGFYTIIWDAKDNRGYDVSSGTYFCRMEAGNFSKVRRMTLLR